jgi:acetolactate synthase-1/2/3 large subunit
MNVSEFIVKELIKYGINTTFSVTGGGSMYLNDALGKNKKFKKIYMHHEQACAMAAEAYARVKKKPALVCVTTGPGGINALNGVFGAYTDSIPMIVISGQVKRETSMSFNKVGKLRQLGDQENDIISMVKKITKENFLIKKKSYLLNNFKNMLKISEDNRPGPIWIDIPIDIQGEKI